MGRPEISDAKIVEHYLSLFRDYQTHVFTLHAEIEAWAGEICFVSSSPRAKTPACNSSAWMICARAAHPPPARFPCAIKCRPKSTAAAAGGAQIA